MSRESDPSAPERLDALFRALASTDRRRVLYYLREQGEATRDELADVLAGWRATNGAGVAGPGERRKIAVSLAHVHLPMLREAGVVTVDPGTDVVSLVPLSSPVEGCLEAATAAEATALDRADARHGESR